MVFENRLKVIKIVAKSRLTIGVSEIATTSQSIFAILKHDLRVIAQYDHCIGGIGALLVVPSRQVMTGSKPLLQANPA